GALLVDVYGRNPGLLATLPAGRGGGEQGWNSPLDLGSRDPRIAEALWDKDPTKREDDRFGTVTPDDHDDDVPSVARSDDEKLHVGIANAQVDVAYDFRGLLQPLLDRIPALLLREADIFVRPNVGTSFAS